MIRHLQGGDQSRIHVGIPCRRAHSPLRGFYLHYDRRRHPEPCGHNCLPWRDVVFGEEKSKVGEHAVCLKGSNSARLLHSLDWRRAPRQPDGTDIRSVHHSGGPHIEAIPWLPLLSQWHPSDSVPVRLLPSRPEIQADQPHGDFGWGTVTKLLAGGLLSKPLATASRDSGSDNR